jgi:hypothetical protein
MHFSLSIVRGLAQMVVVAASQHGKREKNGNVDLKRLNLRQLVGSQGNESEGEDDDDLE